MVEYYFENIEKQKELKIILSSWLDTPYKHHVGVKGLGCDCIHFVHGVFVELGKIPKNNEKLPDYPRDWHIHNTRELLIETIPKYLKGEIYKITGKPYGLCNGDIILSHYGKASSHAGIYFNDYVYQSIDGVGVKRITFNDQDFKMQMKFIYRILK